MAISKTKNGESRKGVGMEREKSVSLKRAMELPESLKPGRGKAGIFKTRSAKCQKL